MAGKRPSSAASALGLIMLLLACSAGAAMAQDRRDALEALEALERERTQVLRDVQARSTPQWFAAPVMAWLPPVDGEAPCFAITRFELTSDAISATQADVSDFGGLLQDLGAFEGACLGPQILDALRRNLDARLVSQGLVTSSVSFALQNLASGVLRVNLQLGRVARIGRRGAASAIGRHALAMKPGDVRNLRAIEQTLENLARLPSQTAQFQIEAADQPDQSAVAIAVEPARTWCLVARSSNEVTNEIDAFVRRARCKPQPQP